MVSESSQLRANFCAKNPAHRQSANRYLQFMRTITLIFLTFFVRTYFGQTLLLSKYVSGCWVSTKAMTPDMKAIKKDGCGTVLVRPDTLRFLDSDTQKRQRHLWTVVNDSTVESTHYWTETEIKKDPSLASINPSKVQLNIRKVNKDEFLVTNYGSECRPVQYFLSFRRINCR